PDVAGVAVDDRRVEALAILFNTDPGDGLLLVFLAVDDVVDGDIEEHGGLVARLAAGPLGGAAGLAQADLELQRVRPRAGADGRDLELPSVERERRARARGVLVEETDDIRPFAAVEEEVVHGERHIGA